MEVFVRVTGCGTHSVEKKPSSLAPSARLRWLWTKIYRSANLGPQDPFLVAKNIDCFFLAKDSQNSDTRRFRKFCSRI